MAYGEYKEYKEYREYREYIGNIGNILYITVNYRYIRAVRDVSRRAFEGDEPLIEPACPQFFFFRQQNGPQISRAPRARF